MPVCLSTAVTVKTSLTPLLVINNHPFHTVILVQVHPVSSQVLLHWKGFQFPLYSIFFHSALLFLPSTVSLVLISPRLFGCYFAAGFTPINFQSKADFKTETLMCVYVGLCPPICGPFPLFLREFTSEVSSCLLSRRVFDLPSQVINAPIYPLKS